MNTKLQPLLEAYIQKLKAIYQDTLQSVILYGSYARGEASTMSDVDIMILVNSDDEGIRAKNEALIYMTYDFNMDHDLDIQPIAESVATYHYWIGAHPFYQNVNREGVILYAAA